MKKVALSIMAHPDDCEILCAGTLSLLHQKGWKIHIATMTAGDCGSMDLNKEEISKIRKKEAEKSAQILDGKYYCLEREDIFIMYDKSTLLKTIDLIRRIQPQIVLAPSPRDYMVDHETTSKLVKTACFAAGMPNIKTNNINLLDKVPYLYYSDPLDGKDSLGLPIEPSFIIDISDSLYIKKKMLSCHESQRNWLRSHHGIDEYIISMQNFSRKRGCLINVQYGEGFRMHLGHAFPQINIMKSELGDKVVDL